MGIAHITLRVRGVLSTSLLVFRVLEVHSPSVSGGTRLLPRPLSDIESPEGSPHGDWSGGTRLLPRPLSDIESPETSSRGDWF